MAGGRPPPFPPEAEALLRSQAKAELRRRLVAVRRALPRDAARARSDRAIERLRQLPAFQGARTVLGYWPMRGEVDPRAAFDAVWAGGGTVALPRVDWARDLLVLHAHAAGEALEESGMGFFQPAASRPPVAPEDVDLVLVPAVAVDDRGYRIGLGKGYYDRLLPTLSRAVSVALVFDFQLVAEVPEDAHDAPVHHVVTDRAAFAGRVDGERCPDAS